jgi:hypothetical protein
MAKIECLKPEVELHYAYKNVLRNEDIAQAAPKQNYRGSRQVAQIDSCIQLDWYC